MVAGGGTNQGGNNGLIPGLIPTFGQTQQCPTFPNNCGLNPFNLNWNVLSTPQVDIPYCQR